VNAEPNTISADQEPKSPIANYRKISEDLNIASEAMRPKKYIFGPKLRFAIAAGHAYFEAMPRKSIAGKEAI